MSLTYESQKGRGRRSQFDVNSAGAYVLCQLHLTLGLPTHDDGLEIQHTKLQNGTLTITIDTDKKNPPTRVPYSATAAQCAEWSKVISDQDRIPIIVKNRPEHGFEGTTREYYLFTQSWAAFLLKCSNRGGYATPL